MSLVYAFALQNAWRSLPILNMFEDRFRQRQRGNGTTTVNANGTKYRPVLTFINFLKLY